MVNEIDALYLLVGIALLVVAIVDLLWTTLWVDGGAGPLSSRLTTWVWHGLQKLGGQRSRILSLSGPLVLMLTLSMWVGLIWAGWTFLFIGGGNTLIDTRNPGPISWVEAIYFVAYTMFTMGNGDFSPVDGIWQIATALTTASGMLFVTLSVSYVLSVLGAVSNKRSFATNVTGLGMRSESVVRTVWSGQCEDFDEFDLPLNEYSAQLNALAEQHQSYPILHYYHSKDPQEASAMGVAILDETLTMLRFGVPEEYWPNETLVQSTRASSQNYLRTLNGAFIEPADRAPPPPDLDRLREAGIPTVSDDEFEDALEDLDERRRKLLGVVAADGWTWPPPER